LLLFHRPKLPPSFFPLLYLARCLVLDVRDFPRYMSHVPSFFRSSPSPPSCVLSNQATLFEARSTSILLDSFSSLFLSLRSFLHALQVTFSSLWPAPPLWSCPVDPRTPDLLSLPPTRESDSVNGTSLHPRDHVPLVLPLPFFPPTSLNTI